MRPVLLLAISVWLSSCAQVTTAPTMEDLRLEFAAEKVQGFVESPEIIVTGGDQKITIQGGLWTPCGGYTLDAEATDGSTITLRVIANANSPNRACRRVVESFAYDARVRGLPSGTYQVRVLHVFKWWEGDPNPEAREVQVASVQVR